MNGVVIVAAGTGSRMNMGINKQFIKLEGKEIIAYTIEKFYNNSNIEDIVVVVKEDESEFLKKEILDKYNFKVDNICTLESKITSIAPLNTKVYRNN